MNPDRTWYTGYVPPEWPPGYMHLARSPDDPERSPRGGASKKRWGVAPHQRMRKMDRDELREEMLAALGDDELTFNAIVVRAFDLTADVVYQEPPDELLWEMVAAEILEHTNRVPIFFRKRKADKPKPEKRDTDMKTNMTESYVRKLGTDIYDARVALGPEPVTDSAKAKRKLRQNALDIAAAFNAIALGSLCPEEA